MTHFEVQEAITEIQLKLKKLMNYVEELLTDIENDGIQDDLE